MNNFKLGIDFDNLVSPLSDVELLNLFIQICSQTKINSIPVPMFPSEEKTFPGAFVDWDNTARRKDLNGSIFVGSTPEKFTIYLSKQIHRMFSLYNSEFLFINAWNEWAEGTYLEPDKKHGFAYLEGVKQAINRGMKTYKKDESY
ncbi:glycoside hydrolase family 99-like domain-containing protein [Bacillus paramobilis]|uniref:glycoside hydrolase family 99-like domain-containing protein n=1 Tax=Bacillus paramobilis TaxID=2817477 RepID=UPI0011A305A9